MAVETFIHATEINNQDESRSFVIVYFFLFYKLCNNILTTLYAG